MFSDYSEDDLTPYLAFKKDCDGNELEYELANFYQWIMFRNRLYNAYYEEPSGPSVG